MPKQLTPKEELQGMLGCIVISLLCWWLSGKFDDIWHTVTYWGAIIFAFGAVSALFGYIKGCFRRAKEYDNQPQTPINGERYNPDTGEIFESPRSAYFSNWDESLTPVWQGEFEATFSYLNRKTERTRRTVVVTNIERSPRGALYFRGFCQLRNEVRTFALDRIKTKLTIDGKKYDLWEYVNEKIGGRPS